MVSAFSGTTNLSFNPANGGLFFINNAAIAIPNGNYVIAEMTSTSASR